MSEWLSQQQKWNDAMTDIYSLPQDGGKRYASTQSLSNGQSETKKRFSRVDRRGGETPSSLVNMH